MAYVPKTLVIGRCVRCGKKLYRGDEVYYCPSCEVYYCSTCAKKIFYKCAICGKDLQRR